MKTHQDIDQRSLELHRLAAQKMRADPQLFIQARSRLERWIAGASSDAQKDLAEWKRLMDLGQEACLAVAVEDTQYAAALRQSSPLCFFMNHKERFQFLKQWHQEPSIAAP